MDHNVLLGAMRLEYRRASWFGLAKLACSFLIVLPPIIALLDTSSTYVYALASLSLFALVLWLIVDWLYQSSRSKSLSARRALMVSNGTGEPLHPSIVSDLQELTQHFQEENLKIEVSEYYASQEDAGAKRLLSIVEESAFYSERTQAYSGRLLSIFVIGYVVFFIGAIVIAIPSLDSLRLEVLMQFFMIVAAFVLSGDLFQRAVRHRTASSECRRIQKTCLAISQTPVSSTNALLLLVDYLSAIESAPETLPSSFSEKRKKLIEALWAKRYST